MSDQLHGRFYAERTSLCVHHIKGWMDPSAGVTVDDLFKKQNLLTFPGIEPPVLRLSTETLATMPITLLGVGQTVEEITSHSLPSILKQVPSVTGVVFL
jgi:hypothetical protein